ncbi:hypothetical protein OHE73_03465, partial [Escherichia coli]|nr:hypothetical protein [Escherichia coli]
VNDAYGYAKGIIIQGKNSSLTANRLTVDVVGQTSAIGINLVPLLCVLMLLARVMALIIKGIY